MLSGLSRFLENKKVTGAVIGFLSFMVIFLWFWKSGVDSSPKRRHSEVEEEEQQEKHQAKASPSVTSSDDLNSFLLEKKTFIFNHMGANFRRVCRIQAVATSSCARLSCDDGKIYCVSSYTEL